jgi:CBS domain-containing protein
VSVLTTVSATLRFSQLRHGRLLDKTGEQIGRVDDLIVRLGGNGYPAVTGIQGRIGGRQVFVPIDRVSDLAPGRAVLSGQLVNLGRFERREGEVLIGHDILGHRLINVDSGRLITAWEIELDRVDGAWELRRVDSRHEVKFPWLNRGGDAEVARSDWLIDWVRVEPLVGHVPSAKVSIPLARLRRLHPAQIADLVEAASHDEGQEIMSAAGSDPELEADIFEELNDEHQVEFLKGRTDDDAAHVLSSMGPDDAADLIAQLPVGRRASILDRLPQPEQEKVRRLLAYNPDTAGGLMTPEFVSALEDTKVESALQSVREAEADVTTIYVVNAGAQLVGTCAVARLLKCDSNLPCSSCLDTKGATVRVHDDFTDVALLMADYNLASAPVIDDDGRLVGVISVDDVLENLIPDEWRRRNAGSAG